MTKALQPPRSRAARREDAMTMLATPGIDVWVATAATDGLPHLVPLSLAWVDERVVVAVPETSVTAHNLTRSGRARLAVGPTRDVVMIDAVVEHTVDATEDPTLGASYVAQADWDPRGSSGYVFVVLRPHRVQAWREVNEIPGRTLMREGHWLDGTAREQETVSSR